MKTVNHQLVQLALARTDGSSFERFVQAFMAATIGQQFVPLGGNKDGGADGMIDDGIFAGPKPGHFMQASVQEDFRYKIRATVNRLRAVGRAPTTLSYYGSRTIPLLDKEADELSDELSVAVRIRDEKYIVSHINASPQTVQAFESYLEPHIAYLKQIGGSSLIRECPDLPARALCVFLGQEVDRRRGNTQLLEAVTDSLILWALEGTDPDSAKLMTKDEIRQKIEEALPAARTFIKGSIDLRLRHLSSKSNSNGREIRHYRKEGKYCLPYETRALIFKENVEDEALKSAVTDIFRARAREHGAGDNLLEVAVEACHRTLNISFEKQGLEIASFIGAAGSDASIQSSISDNMDRAISEIGISKNSKEAVKAVGMPILRKTFYESTEVERRYLSKLSRTYTLLFVLKNEPRIVEYFRGMSSKFVLYVGSDLIVRALSERYLKSEDRMTVNLFKILAAAGSQLILSEIALQEICTHLQKADREFRKNYLPIEPDINFEFARHIDRILIRAYFYARLNGDASAERPRGWPSFVEQFCTYDELHAPTAEASLRRSLCEEFGFVFEDMADMQKGVDPDELESVASRLGKIRQRPTRMKEAEEILARNDANHVLRVYAKRRELKEISRSNPYGFRSWWLTQETWILQATSDVVRNRAAPYMIRPEFLLNFIALNPSLEEVRRSFDTIFPSLLGVKLSNRMRSEVFKTVVDSVLEVSQLGEGRARAKVAELSDRLKGDQFKRYEVELSARGVGRPLASASPSGRRDHKL